MPIARLVFPPVLLLYRPLQLSLCVQYVAPILEDPIMAEVMKSMTGAGAGAYLALCLAAECVHRRPAESGRRAAAASVGAEPVLPVMMQLCDSEESERGTFELSVKSSTGDLKALQVPAEASGCLL